MRQHLRLARREIRRCGGTVPPMSNQLPRGAKGRRLLGPAMLRSCPSASQHGQVQARLGPGGYCRCSEGGPQTCLPTSCGVAQRRPSTAHLHQRKLKTLTRGQASRGGRHGAFSGTASSGWLTRRRRDQGGVPHEAPMTQAMTTGGARRVPARATSSLPLWCKGGKRSRGVPRHQTKVAVSVQQDQDQEDCNTEVIVEPRTTSSPEPCAGEDCFC